MTSRRLLVLTFSLLAIPLAAQVESLDINIQIPSLIADQKLDAAEQIIVDRLVDQPHDAGLITYLSEVRLNQGHPDEALRLAQDAIQFGGSTALRLQVAGLAESARGHLGPAEGYFRRALELDPKFAPAHYYLARLLYTRNRFDEAITESRATIALSPDFVRAYENLGLCYEGKDDSKEAERWYREAVHRDADSPKKTEWPLLDFATLLIREDRIDEAQPYLQQALAVNPANAQSHFQMGILREKQGGLRQALEELQTAIKLNPRFPGALYRAARICKKLGHQEESQHYFDEYKKVSGSKG